MRSLVRLCFSLIFALTLVIALSSSQKTSAATITVNSLGDTADVAPGDGKCADASGACTLRAAIQEVNSAPFNNVINVSANGTINLTGPLPTFAANMTINGPGSSLLTVRRSSGGDYRIFTVRFAIVTISGMTVANGKTPDGAPAVNGAFFGNDGDAGGGIWNSGSLTLTDVVVTGNRTGNGGAINGDFGGWGGYGGGIYSSGTLTMTRVVVSNNTTGGGGVGGFGGPGGPGGGIYFNGSLLTMTNVVVSGNTTGNAGVGTTGAMGGGGGTGAGIYGRAGTLNLSNVTVTGNTAGDGDDGGYGGGIYNYTGTTMTMTDCTISNNSSGQGGSKFVSAGGWGGGIANDGAMMLIRCTVSGNVTKGHLPGGGAGTDGIGGGIFTGNSLTVIDSTISGNHAYPGSGRGGGIYNGGNALTLTNVTVTGNTAAGPNGYQNAQGVHSGGTANVSNTIIAGNGSGGTPDVTGTFNSHGHNLIGAATPGNGNGSSDESGFVNGSNADQVGSLASPIDARLAPLADNGGPTRTHALLAGSPALDAGDNALAKDANGNTLTTDQRGSGRVAGATSTVDIGAYEFHPLLEQVSDKATNEDTPLSFSFDIGDAAGANATVAASSDNQSLLPDANLALTGSGPMRTLQLTPAADQNGSAHVTLSVTDSNGSATSSFLLNVAPINDAPSFTKGADQTVAEDSGPQSVAGWATAISAGPADESGQALSFVVTGDTNPGIFSAAPAISASGALTYTSAHDANGSATITVVLKDDGGTAGGGQDTSAAQTFKITVTPVNDPPVANNDQYSVNQDGRLSISAPGVLSNDADVDHDALTAELVSGPANGTLALSANGSFTYTPRSGYVGADSFTYRAGDGQAFSAAATVSLNVVAVNHAPVNIVPAAPQRAGPGPLVLSAANGNRVAVSDVDAGNNPVRVSLTATNGTITLKTTAGLTFTAGSGTNDAFMTFTGTISDINGALDGMSFTPRQNFSGPGLLQIQTNDLGNTGAGGPLSDTDAVSIAILPGGLLQFSSSAYQFGEGVGRATITITRTGDTSGPVSVTFNTVDDPAPVPCDPTAKQPDGSDYPHGVAYARCDYATTVSTVTFAAGDSAPKTVTIPIIDDVYVEGPETVHLRLLNPTGGSLGAQSTATLTITDNDFVPGATNPILITPFFVRQQYLDFLSREPEVGEPWSATLNNCAPGDTLCDRISVSANFFRSQEFQLKGLFVFKFYKVSFGRLPLYSEIVADMSSVTGTTTADLIAKKAAFTDAWVQRTDFTSAYAGMSNPTFVNTLMGRYNLQSITTPDPAAPDNGAKVTLTSTDLINRLNAATLTRAQVVRAIASSDEVGAVEFNPAFVAMQYFGYLRRDPEPGGYQAWLNTINANPSDFRSMVNGFMNSTEYRLRFGQP